MSAPQVTLRPIAPEDEPFLRRVYASTRLDELAPLGWSAEQQQGFLNQQFDTQHSQFQTHYADAEFLVILLGEQPIGRLYVARWPEQIALLDIALLPEHRGAGIGTRLLGALIDEAAAASKPLRLHVEKFNRAQRLYQRLGFYTLEDQGVYWYMELSPARAAGSRPTALRT